MLCKLGWTPACLMPSVFTIPKIVSRRERLFPRRRKTAQLKTTVLSEFPTRLRFKALAVKVYPASVSLS